MRILASISGTWGSGVLLSAWLAMFAFTATAEDPVAEPDELVQIRSSYQDALETATTPIHARYREVLEKLKAQLIEKNELDAALAVKAELERLDESLNVAPAEEDGSSVSSAAAEKTLRTFLQRVEFAWKAQSAGEVVVRFGPETVKVVADGKQIMEKEYTILADDQLQFQWGSGDLNTFVISQDKSRFTRVAQKSDLSVKGEIRPRTN